MVALGAGLVVAASTREAEEEPAAPAPRDPEREPTTEPLEPVWATLPGVDVLLAGDAIVATNDHGEWTIRTECIGPARRGGGTGTVGPAYVSRVVTGEGELLLDDEREPAPLNDPGFGGLGAFAWHHARGRPGALRLGADNAWEVSGRVCAEDNGGFGVSGARVLEPPAVGEEGGRPFVGFALEVAFSDGWTYPRALLRARYRYRVERDVVRVWIAVTQLCHEGLCGGTSELAFVKEPKVVAAFRRDGPLPFARTVVTDAEGEPRCLYVGGGPATGPVLETGQCAHRERARVRFDAGDEASGLDGGCEHVSCLEVEAAAVEASGEDVTPGAPTARWQGAGLGFDAWAETAAERPAAFPRDTTSLDGVVWDCHGGSPAGELQRLWETIGRLDEEGRYLGLSVLFPAWQGGRGGYDCEPLSRTFGPEGETWAGRSPTRAGSRTTRGDDTAQRTPSGV